MNKFIYFFSCVSLILFGCSPYNNKHFSKKTFDLSRQEQQIQSFFSDDSPIKYTLASFDIIFPRAVNLSSKYKNIKLKDFSFKGTFNDFVDILKLFKISCLVDIGLNQQRQILIDIPYFSGNFAELAQSIANTNGLLFREENGTLIIKTQDNFSITLVSLPDDFSKLILDEINKNKLFSNVHYSPLSQKLSWTGNAQSIFEIKKIFSEVMSNYSRIDFEIIIFESSASSVKDFEFSALTQYKSKNIGVRGALSLGNPGNIGSVLDKAFTVNAHDFNLLFTWMLQQGKVRIVQKMFLSTMNLMKGELKVGEKIPYISNISQAYVNTTNSNGNTAAIPQVNVSFAEVLSGVQLEIKPRLVKELASVQAKLKLSVKNVVELREIKAGSQSYARPHTSEREIESNLLMQLGKVYIFGGFATDTFTHKTSTGGPFGYQKQNDRRRLFFAIRPSVVIFVDKK